MYVLRNISDEDLEILSGVDPGVEGCNLMPGETTTMTLRTDDTMCWTGYHPGMLMTVRPKKNPEIARGYKDWKENDESIARSERWMAKRKKERASAKKETDSRLDRKSNNNSA